MAELPVSTRWTIDDLHRLPADETKRYEVIDGELFVSTTPRFEHQFACARSIVDLGNWNDQVGLGVVLVAPGLIFSHRDGVAPDLAWISHTRLAAILRDDGHLWGPPELVVEVLSPGAENERRDREVKLRLYSRFGVDEYWLLDWRLKQVQVYRQLDGELRLVVTLGPQDELTSPVLPGFAVVVARLFLPA
jgi:Uma2 family endonuclease